MSFGGKVNKRSGMFLVGAFVISTAATTSQQSAFGTDMIGAKSFSGSPVNQQSAISNLKAFESGILFVIMIFIIVSMSKKTFSAKPDEIEQNIGPEMMNNSAYDQE